MLQMADDLAPGANWRQAQPAIVLIKRYLKPGQEANYENCLRLLMTMAIAVFFMACYLLPHLDSLACTSDLSCKKRSLKLEEIHHGYFNHWCW